MGLKAKATLLAVIALLTLCGQCLAVLQDIEVVTKADGSLNFLVVGDWGRKGHYNQSNVATQACLPCPDWLNQSTEGQKQCISLHFLTLMPERRSFTVKSSLRTSFTDTRCLSSVQLFFVDTTPFVDKYWEMPNKHKYDWRGILPRRKYLRRQLQAVTMALNASNATWKIVVGHHPIRSVGHHGDTSELIQQLLPILEANNVDLYINGHDHCLEHISSITSPIQFLTSGGGSKSWKGLDQEANTDGLQMYYDGQGFMSIEINPTTLRAAFL
eukprot:Gb_22783 [translate_table: standard]